MRRVTAEPILGCWPNLLGGKQPPTSPRTHYSQNRIDKRVLGSCIQALSMFDLPSELDTVKTAESRVRMHVVARFSDFRRLYRHKKAEVRQKSLIRRHGWISPAG